MRRPATSPCRHCGATLHRLVADLGATPVANDLLLEGQLAQGEVYYPLRAFVCDACKLVQIEDIRKADDLFREDYVYFSSVSSSWLAHAAAFCDMAANRFNLGPQSLVVELASNDGYLLRFMKARGVPVLGIEPAASVAKVARETHQIETLELFFGRETAAQVLEHHGAAQLIVANNVLAHVPDINDFVAGVGALLHAEGVASFEFPHVQNLIAKGQFDTIYHEHFSYLSLTALDRVFAKAGLRVFDVEALPTHGGSLRLFVAHQGSAHAETARVRETRDGETAFGLSGTAVYDAFAQTVQRIKFDLVALLHGLKRQGARIAAYGAPAKGNTLLNFCGIGADVLDFTVDRSPAKQNRYLPGSRLPILAPEAIFSHRPDYILILPWNLEAEITAALEPARAWGCRFIVPVPSPRIL